MLEPTEPEVRAFLGPRAEYYLQRWKQELWGEGGALGGINWAAFLLSGLWLPYRKMYRISILLWGIILVESIGEDILLGESAASKIFSRLVGLAAAIVCGVFGNRWYLSHARKVIAAVRSQGLPEEEHLRVLTRRGGTSLLASLLCIVLFLVVGIALFMVLAVLQRSN
jgi:hypothetical protein